MIKALQNTLSVTRVSIDTVLNPSAETPLFYPSPNPLYQRLPNKHVHSIDLSLFRPKLGADCWESHT